MRSINITKTAAIKMPKAENNQHLSSIPVKFKIDLTPLVYSFIHSGDLFK